MQQEASSGFCDGKLRVRAKFRPATLIDLRRLLVSRYLGTVLQGGGYFTIVPVDEVAEYGSLIHASHMHRP